VPREFEGERLVRRAFDGEDFVRHAHALGPVAVAVRLGVVRRRLVDVDVLLVGVEDRQRESAVAVVAERDARHGGLPGADGVELRRGQMHEVAQRRDRVGAVRIAAEDGPARGGAARVDDPVVRAFESGVPDHLAEVVDLGPGEGLVEGRGQPLGGEGHRGGCELEVVERLERQAREIEPGRRLRNPQRLDHLTQQVRPRIGASHDIGPLQLGDGVAAERVGADADDVLGRPARRARAERAELRRQPVGLALGQRDIGVDARDEGRADRAGVGCVGGPFRFHVAPVEEEPRGAILGEVAGAEVGREKAKAPLAPQIDLPQPVARRVEALDEEEVVEALGLEVRNTPAIDMDARRTDEPRDVDRLLGRRHAAFSACATCSTQDEVAASTHPQSTARAGRELPKKEMAVERAPVAALGSAAPGSSNRLRPTRIDPCAR
jgi:hypothetical protein